ncbi:MAG: extracellular solute-binding protein [Anaerolineae bacterium]|jgi:multiple sugar transport system substrate-binding protein
MKTGRTLSRRNLLRLSGLAAFSLGAAACGGATPAPAGSGGQAAAATSAASPAAATGEKTTVRWQDWPDWEPNLDKIMARIEQDLPHLNVEFETLGDGFEDKTLAAMVAGTAPDVTTGWGPIFRVWAEKGQLLDLQPFVDRDFTAERIADFHEFQWNGMVAKDSGIRFAVPFYVNLIMLYYNKEAFDEAGVPYPTADMDHDDYAQMLMATTKVEDGKVVRWGGSITPSSYDRFQVHVQAYGGHVVNPDDWTECWLGKDEALEALEWMRARLWDDNSIAQPMQLQGIGQATGTQAGPWAARMLATEEGGMGAVAFYATESPFEFALTHIPEGPARRSTLGTTDGYAIYKGSKNIEGAWDLLKFLTDDFFQGMVTETWGGIPARLSLLPNWKDTIIKSFPTLENANMDAILEALEWGYPMTTEEFKVHSESQSVIEAALQKVFEVGDTPVDYFIQVADEVTKINREG